MKKINIPTYITGTWTNTMHGMGAIRGWLKVQSEKKWLRWHPWQEWFDLWGNPQANDELVQFFHHFLKDVDNDWESTPRVRMGVLKFGESAPLENVVEEDFPLPRTQYKKAFLETAGKLSIDKTPQMRRKSHTARRAANTSLSHTRSREELKSSVCPRQSYTCLAKTWMTWMCTCYSARSPHLVKKC
jgi:hypothetical protein